MLWEIGRGNGEVRSLRARLHLDSGYMSRVLRALERDGLVVSGRRGARPPGPHRAPDREGEEPSATCSIGAATRSRRRCSTRSDDRQRAQLVAAMADVERLLTAALIRVVAVDPSHPDAVRCLHAYFEELSERFDGGFEERQSRTYELDEVRPPHGIVLVAYLDDRAIGCGSLKGDGKHPPEIKRLWVDREARGLGVGRRLLEALEDRAASTGARSVRLDTNAALTEAIALYRATGYIEVSPFNNETYAHHWFSKRVAKRQVGYKDK